ncbi:RHS repeat-associated core domain-containing protein, partial [Gammaproteobacteria bacterium]|nr:RHS repeat-associated core domain-containing protein [Gammaproteobacteria bacterium]
AQSELSTGQVIDYAFDGVGNRTNVTGGDQPGAYTLDNSTPDPSDFQVNQYTTTAFDNRMYDENGNLVIIINSLTQQRDLGYDYRNQMVSHADQVSSLNSTYAYDVLGRRIAKNVGGDITLYFYDGWRVLEEQSETNQTQAAYIYGRYIDEVLAMTRNGEGYFYHSDDLYNVMNVTDGNGLIAENYEYGDFGMPLISDVNGSSLEQSVIRNSYLFVGRRYDNELGHYYYRLRYLDPSSGRFTTKDPIGIWGDKLNLGGGYTYASNNPWSRLDPTGTRSKEPGADNCDIYCEIEILKDKEELNRKVDEEEYQRQLDSNSTSFEELERVRRLSQERKWNRFIGSIDDFGKGLSDMSGATETYHQGKTYAEHGEIGNYNAYVAGVLAGGVFDMANVPRRALVTTGSGILKGARGVKSAGRKFLDNFFGGRYADDVASDIAKYSGQKYGNAYDDDSEMVDEAVSITIRALLR